jgi:K+-sensing histidine kinase KdpD
VIGSKVRHPHLRAATIVLASVVLATFLTFPVSPIVIHSRDLLFIVAVIVASRYAGAIAGLCTALLSVLVFDWFFDRTPHVLDFTFAVALRAVVFGSLSLLVASLEKQRRRAIRRLEDANSELRNALNEIKILRGTLPICTYCKQIRTDAGTWIQIEEYIHEHSEADFTHSLCPDCLRERYPDIYEKKYGGDETYQADPDASKGASAGPRPEKLANSTSF